MAASAHKATQLREYSHALQRLKEQELAELAGLHARDPARLVARIRESAKTVSGYPSIDEPFRETAITALPTPPKTTGTVTRTPHFVAHVATDAVWPVDGGLSFRYVAREISPLRSALPGSPRSARRSIDLVLSNADDHTLIVGELKIRNDVTTYQALIQALMYAAELTTPSQIKRVKKYLNADVKLAKSAADIYLIAFDPPVKGRYRPMIDAHTMVIAEKLMRNADVRKRVRRIVHLEAALRGGALSFTTKFHFPN